MLLASIDAIYRGEKNHVCVGRVAVSTCALLKPNTVSQEKNKFGYFSNRVVHKNLLTTIYCMHTN
jgi:hypothetical protein